MAVQHLENCLAARSSSEQRCKKLICIAAFWCSRSCRGICSCHMLPSATLLLIVVYCYAFVACIFEALQLRIGWACQSLVSISCPAGQRSARLVTDVHVTLPRERVKTSATCQ